MDKSGRRRGEGQREGEEEQEDGGKKRKEVVMLPMVDAQVWVCGYGL
jgi:hypothetical protein